MAFRNIPPNGFPAVPDIEDLEGVENELASVKSGLTDLNNYLFNDVAQSNLDFNTLKTACSYRIGNLGNCTNTPDGTKTGATGVFICEPHGSYILQQFYGNLGVSHRFSYDAGSTWNNWI